MADPPAPVANMTASVPFVTNDVQVWMDSNPDRAAEAFARDQSMQKWVKRMDHYHMYEQGSALVIARRMALPPACSSATGTPLKTDVNGEPTRKYYCNLCEKEVNDFTRHDREHHLRDPGKLWICPIGRGCSEDDPSMHWDTLRDGTTTIDEHMVNAHNDFRHRKGYAGRFLWRMSKKGTLSHLNKAPLLYILHKNQSIIPAYIARRDQALLGLQARFPPDEVKAWGLVDLPSSTIRDPVEVMTIENGKNYMVDYVINLRRHLALWEDAIFMAESIIADHDEQMMLGQTQVDPIVDDGLMTPDDGLMDLDEEELDLWMNKGV